MKNSSLLCRYLVKIYHSLNLGSTNLILMFDPTIQLTLKCDGNIIHDIARSTNIFPMNPLQKEAQASHYLCAPTRLVAIIRIHLCTIMQCY
ncbi:hypothetical protein CDL12_01375 [Handroanthus impetiginosus]|uniref:Uncharacterized protein n=1 Tax=Handroanthus impetiginosus TaxID=429701 RepID=A0A2G9I808_9LAMI|nr:hypothetical protein CDL12_01375 [Handroanthus impetiginosus]